MGGSGTELSTRSDGKDLPALAAALALEPLLDADAQLAAWRVIEAFSRAELPFELELGWSSGGGSGAVAKVTVSRSARICVFARGLRIRAGNLADVVNRVGVTVADAHADTKNAWETTGVTAGAGVEVDVPVPPFARSVRVELADSGVLWSTTLRIYDGANALRAAVLAGDQPTDGLLLGGARRVTVENGGAGGPYAFRAVFLLCL